MTAEYNPEKTSRHAADSTLSDVLPAIPVETSPAGTMLHHLLRTASEWGAKSFGALTDDFSRILGDTDGQLFYIPSKEFLDRQAWENAASEYVRERKEELLELLRTDEDPLLRDILADMPAPQPIAQVHPPLPSAVTDPRVEHLLTELCNVAATHLKTDPACLSFAEAQALSVFIKQVGGDQFDRQARDVKTQGNGYHEACTACGIEISVGWDEGYGSFTIYLPQIETEVGYERGVGDQVIILSEREDEAKRIYDFAVDSAASATDVYDLYHRLDKKVTGSEDQAAEQ